MSARRKQREKIFKMAAESFEGHILERKIIADITKPALHDPSQEMIERRTITWRCGRPDTNMYSFWVAELPGCIVQWGDVGGLMIPQWGGYDIEWLRRSINSVDYVLEKAKAEKSRFVPEMFAEYLRELESFDCEELFGVPLDKLDPSYENFVVFMESGHDTEAGYCCYDYPPDVLWAYAALKRFCELLSAQ